MIQENSPLEQTPSSDCDAVGEEKVADREKRLSRSVLPPLTRAIQRSMLILSVLVMLAIAVPRWSLEGRAVAIGVGLAWVVGQNVFLLCQRYRNRGEFSEGLVRGTWFAVAMAVAACGVGVGLLSLTGMGFGSAHLVFIVVMVVFSAAAGVLCASDVLREASLSMVVGATLVLTAQLAFSSQAIVVTTVVGLVVIVAVASLVLQLRGKNLRVLPAFSDLSSLATPTIQSALLAFGLYELIDARPQFAVWLFVVAPVVALAAVDPIVVMLRETLHPTRGRSRSLDSAVRRAKLLGVGAVFIALAFSVVAIIGILIGASLWNSLGLALSICAVLGFSMIAVVSTMLRTFGANGWSAAVAMLALLIPWTLTASHAVAGVLVAALGCALALLLWVTILDDPKAHR